MTAEQRARKLIASRTMEQLITNFEITETLNGSEVPMVRGWIMDELEKRDPEAFDKWLDSYVDSPRKFFLN